MATAPAPTWMTAEQLMALRDDGNRYELGRGTLICMRPSAYRPARVAGRVMGQLFPFIEAHQLGDYGSAEAGFRLAVNPDTVRAPDAWFVRAARVPTADQEEASSASRPIWRSKSSRRQTGSET